jgi:DNA polymerase-3 subunit delta
MPESSPVHLVKGGDEVLLADGAHDLVERLVGDADRSEVLTEFRGDDYAMGDVVLAASTVSMFGSRVVVARNASRFGVDDLAPLLAYLQDPAPDAVVVVVWDKPVTPGASSKPLNKKLTDAVKAAGGEVHDCGLPGGKGRGMWADDQMDAATVRLSPPARRLIVERLGDDLSRLGGILTVLDATFGNATIGPDDVEPYLGDAGAVPPWDLTDAIDRGDVAGAVTNLQRLLGNGARHPLQVMVTLQTHVERMLRLDGADVRDEKDAASLLGMKGSPFPAKKAMQQGRKLGSAKIARATKLVAAADVDLRGRTAQDGPAVLETLVARLAALSGSPGSAGRSGSAGRTGGVSPQRRR